MDRCDTIISQGFLVVFHKTQDILNSRYFKLKKFAKLKPNFSLNSSFRKIFTRERPERSLHLREVQVFLHKISIFSSKLKSLNFSTFKEIFLSKLKVSENELTKVCGKRLTKTCTIVVILPQYTQHPF